MKKLIKKLSILTLSFVSFALYAQVPTSGLLHRFQFDSSVMNEAGTVSLSGGYFYGYVNNRYGASSSAVHLTTPSYTLSTNQAIAPLGALPRTIALWVNPQTIFANNQVFTYGHGTLNNTFALSFKSNELSLAGYNNDVTYTAPNLFETNKWYHLAATYTGTEAAVYLNGVQVVVASKSWNTLSGPFNLGSFFAGGGNFNGFIDDLLTYDRALSPAEVAQLYVDGCTSIPTFTQVAPVCEGSASPLPTTSSNGVTGAWSPLWNSNATKTYTFVPSSGQCYTTATMTVTVNPLFVTPTFVGMPPVCQGSASPLPTTSQNGITGTWSPAWNPNATTTYTFTPTAGQCGAYTITRTVTVNPSNVTPTFTQVAPVCSGTNFTLPTTSNNGITGTWSPAKNIYATTTYTFTPSAGQCGATTTTMTVTVNPSNVTPTFTQVAPICQGATLSALPTTSNNGVTGTWSPAVNNNSATTTYTFTPSAGQCNATTATMTIIVNPNNVTPTFTQIAPVCSGTNFTLPTTSNNGVSGTWSPAKNIYATTTYTFTPSVGQCGATTTTMTVTVNPNPYPTFTQIAPVCQGTANPLPTTSQNGITGTWSPAWNTNATTTYTFTPTVGQCVSGNAMMSITISSGVTPTFTQVAPICQGATLSALPTTSNNGVTGTWSPAVNNNATTVYTFTPTAGQCTSGSVTMTITVNPNSSVTPTFTQIAPVCQGTANPLPTTSDNGITGTWSPAWNATATTTYTFTPSAGQCGATTATMTVTVNPSNGQTPTFAIQNSLCKGVASPLPTVSENGIAGTWSPAWNPNASGTYTFTANAGCTNPVTTTVNINTSATSLPLPVDNTPPANLTICAGNTTTLSVSASGTVQWFPDNATHIVTHTGNTFTTPVLNSTTTYYIRQYSGGCYTPRITITVTVVPAGATPTFTQVAPVCQGATMTALPTTSNNGVTGTWSPALDNNTTTTYTFTPNSGQCTSGNTTMPITVNPNVTPVFTQVAPICQGQSLTLPTTSNNGIIGTWSPAINNNATTTYTFTPTAGQCVSGANPTMTITVNPSVAPIFTQVAPICQGTTLSALQTTSNNGVTGTWSPALNNNATTTYTFTPSSGQCISGGNPTMTITVNAVAQTNLDTLVCHGTTLTFGSHAISANGIYVDTLQTTASCDSIVRLQVTYHTPIATTLNVQRCVGSSYVFDGQTLTTDGTHTAVFTSTIGCDSSVTLNLTFVSQITETVNAMICNGNTYTFGVQQLNATGIYTETFQSIGGCDSIVTLNLTVTTIDTTVSVNGNTLTANQAGASYQWINCANNTPVSGAASQTFIPTVSGNYAVAITSNNCMETSACHTVNIVGIDEISMRAIAVYPNPATSYVTIDNLPENSTITVSDLTGKIIYQTTEIGTSTQIQTSAFANGIYNIHINNPSFGGITKKLAISK